MFFVLFVFVFVFDTASSITVIRGAYRLNIFILLLLTSLASEDSWVDSVMHKTGAVDCL